MFLTFFNDAQSYHGAPSNARGDLDDGRARDYREGLGALLQQPAAEQRPRGEHADLEPRRCQENGDGRSEEGQRHPENRLMVRHLMVCTHLMVHHLMVRP